MLQYPINDIIYAAKHWLLTSAYARATVVVVYVIAGVSIIAAVLNETTTCIKPEPLEFYTGGDRYDREFIHLHYTIARYRYIGCSVESMLVTSLFAGVLYVITRLLILYGQAIDNNRTVHYMPQ